MIGLPASEELPKVNFPMRVTIHLERSTNIYPTTQALLSDYRALAFRFPV
jgi:hypothetical protein